jgi:hypothetical protein
MHSRSVQKQTPGYYSRHANNISSTEETGSNHWTKNIGPNGSGGNCERNRYANSTFQKCCCSSAALKSLKSIDALFALDYIRTSSNIQVCTEIMNQSKQSK